MRGRSRDEKQALLARAEQQARSLEEQRSAADSRTAQLAEQARREIEAARQTLEGERDAALAERDARMREALARLERERETQEDQLHSLRSELTELRRDKLRLMGEGADKFFAQLKEKGVKLVAFQPGAGHLTIPMEDLNRYPRGNRSLRGREVRREPRALPALAGSLQQPALPGHRGQRRALRQAADQAAQARGVRRRHA
jgi:hypothetical protein